MSESRLQADYSANPAEAGTPTTSPAEDVVLLPAPATIGPIEARFPAHAMVEVAQQAADHVPRAVAADFDVALAVDADHALVRYADRRQLVGQRTTL